VIHSLPSHIPLKLDTLFQMEDLSRILAVAEAAARSAGALITAFTGKASVESTKADYADLVTATDAQCQQLISEAVRSAFGAGHHFLGEEDVPPGAEAASAAVHSKLSLGGHLWVVDPIDGTTNFVAGLPLSCVSIGVAYNGVVVVGVIYDPHRDEMFSAVRGRGATLNGAPLRTAQCTAMKDALFGWGLHHARHVSKTMLRAADVFVDHTRGLRALGSAALMVSAWQQQQQQRMSSLLSPAGPLTPTVTHTHTHTWTPNTPPSPQMAYVAAGRLAAFFEHELCAWDLAAGSLLVSEAGGVVSDTRGGEYDLRVRDIVVACNPGIHGETLALLQVAKAQHCDSPADWPSLH
jgi:myo-inositol-1(or 4)-monophosphatase